MFIPFFNRWKVHWERRHAASHGSEDTEVRPGQLLREYSVIVELCTSNLHVPQECTLSLHASYMYVLPGWGTS